VPGTLPSSRSDELAPHRPRVAWLRLTVLRGARDDTAPLQIADEPDDREGILIAPRYKPLDVPSTSSPALDQLQ